MKMTILFPLAGLVLAPVVSHAIFIDRSEIHFFKKEERIREEAERNLRIYGSKHAHEPCDDTLVQPAYLPPTPYVNEEKALESLWLAQPSNHREFVFAYILKQSHPPVLDASFYQGSENEAAATIAAERDFAGNSFGRGSILQNTREYLETLRGADNLASLDVKQFAALAGLQALVQLNGPQMLLRSIQKTARANEARERRARYRREVAFNSRMYVRSLFGLD